MDRADFDALYELVWPRAASPEEVRKAKWTWFRQNLAAAPDSGVIAQLSNVRPRLQARCGQRRETRLIRCAVSCSPRCRALLGTAQGPCGMLAAVQAYELQQLFFPEASANISCPLGTSTCVLSQTREGGLSGVNAEERSVALANGIARMLWVVAAAAARAVPDPTPATPLPTGGARGQAAGSEAASGAATGGSEDASSDAQASATSHSAAGSAASGSESSGVAPPAGRMPAAGRAPQATWVTVAADFAAAVASACSVDSDADFEDPFEASALAAAPSASVPCLRTETFESEAALAEAVGASAAALTEPGSPAVVCLLMSLLLTRGVEATAKEARLDPMLATLVYRDGCSEQALLNLCLTGRAVNDVAAQHWVDWTGSPLIGFLTDADGVHAADCFQFPTLPIFVLNSGGHYTTVFSPSPAAAAVDKTPPSPPPPSSGGGKEPKASAASRAGGGNARARAGSADASVDAAGAALAAAETAAMLEAALGPEGAAEALSLAGLLPSSESRPNHPSSAGTTGSGSTGGVLDDARDKSAGSPKAQPGAGGGGEAGTPGRASAAAAASSDAGAAASASPGAADGDAASAARDATSAAAAQANSWRLDPPVFAFFHLNGLRPLHADGKATRESTFRLALFGEFAPSGRAGGKPPKGVPSPAGQQADNKARKIKRILQHRVAPGGSKEGGPFEFLVVCEANGSMEGTGADVPPYWPARWYCRDCTLKGEWGAYNAAEALECVLCSKPARECGWAHWLSESQLPKGMLKDWRRSHAPAALKVLRTRWPRADAEWEGPPPALFG